MNPYSSGDRSALQFSLDKMRHHGLQMPCGISLVDPVVSVGIVESLELFIRSDQGVNKVYGVLVVHIVIPCAMNQQEISFQFVHMGDGAVVVIACRIKLWGLQVPLCIDGII